VSLDTSNPRRRVVIGVVLAAVVIGAVALGWMLTRPDPNRAIAGEVQCATSDAVVGIWITKDGGGSWAAARPGPRGLTYFNGTTNLDAYRVFVGCGGTPSQWAREARSAPISSDYAALICDDTFEAVAEAPHFGICKPSN